MRRRRLVCMRKVGITLLVAGVVVALYWLGKGFFESDYDILLKIAVGVGALGIIFLIVNAVIKHIRRVQKENEKKVHRVEV